MKRYLILAAAVALALSACKQETTVEAPMAAADPAPATPPVTEPVVPAEPAVVVAPASQASFTGYGDMKLGSTLEQAKTAWAGESVSYTHLDVYKRQTITCHSPTQA